MDVDRDTPLAKERAIAQSQLDNDIQANRAAQATVKAAEA
jgi:membrane fusion protein, multidrug efflux system